MKTLRSLCAMAIAMLATSSMWAQQGTTHDHPIDDATVQKYLTEYLGYNGSSWGTPTATTAGEVFFVEVNDYWKGSNHAKNDDGTYGPAIEDQVKYGINRIEKVNQHASIPTGDLYHFETATNRFFFVIRTETMSTNFSDYHFPFRWYNEFSSSSTTTFDNMPAAYEELKGGDFYPVPHSCSNSLEKNHYTALHGNTAIGKTQAISAMLFVPTGANAKTNNKNGGFEGTDIPQIFLYVSSLELERQIDATTACKYKGHLTWETSFDKAKASSAVDFEPWIDGSGKVGVREVSTVYRQIEGSTEWEVVAENLIDTKTFDDKTLPQSENGYNVTYFVVTKAYKCTANGTITNEQMGVTSTSQKSIFIPGTNSSYFELAITNDFNSKFVPDSKTHAMGVSTNHISNQITPKATEFSPTINDIKTGDKFQLVRMENGKKDDVAANTVNITDITTEHVYEDVKRTFTVSGKYNNVDLSEQTDISIAGYTAYGITTSDLKKQEQTGNIKVTFDGTVLPRKIYAKLYVSNSDATATATINGGGTGTITQSTSDRFGSLDRFTEISMTGNTLTFNTSAKRPKNTSYTTRFVILVPNNITEKVDKGIQTIYKYTVNGEAASIKDPANLEPILNATANYTETLDVAPGDTYDVKYQLVYTNADGTNVLRSNVVASKTLKTEVEAEKLYRSGTPDPEHNAAQELYTCRVNFKPINDGGIRYYNIWKNADEVVMRVSQATTETFYMLAKDANGDFNINLGAIKKDADGVLKVRVDAAIDKHANDYEMSSNQRAAHGMNALTINNDAVIFGNDLFFTVEVVDDHGNSYGNIDHDAKYTGQNDELVYNSDVNVFTDNHGNFRAEISWNKMFKAEDKILDEDDYILGEPDYYTVYRTMVDGTGEFKYEPITTRYIGHDGQEYNPYTGETEEAGFTEVDKTTDGSAYKFTTELIKKLAVERPMEDFKVFDFIKLPDLSFTTAQNVKSFFPAMYYVKAHYEKPFEAQTFIARNYIEKNSNPTTTSLPIVTEIEDLQTSQVVNVKYYNMMGIEVAQPEAGEIVVARTQYANGVVTSKVIKK